MRELDATEIAYKNGFEAGRESAIEYGEWIPIYNSDGNFLGWLHEKCGKVVKENSPYCPQCGANMNAKAKDK